MRRRPDPETLRQSAGGAAQKAYAFQAGGRAKPPHDQRHGRRAELPAAGDLFYSPNPWSLNEEGRGIDRRVSTFKPGPGQFDPCHPPLEKTMSPEDAAASWKDRQIYYLKGQSVRSPTWVVNSYAK